MSAPQSLPAPLLDQIVRTIHAVPELRGCMIGYSRLGDCRTLHRGMTPTVNFRDRLVIVEHGSAPAGKIDARQVPATPTTTTEAPAYESNISKLGPELIGLGINLLAFTFSTVGVGAGAASTTVSGPLGVAVAVASWTGVVTSGIQTGNAVLRLWGMALDPQGNQLQRAEANFGTFITVVDFIGLLALGTTAGIAARGAVMAAASRHSALMRGMTPEALKAMKKPAREQFLKSVHAQIVSTPAGKAELEAALKAAKVTMAGAGRERHAAKLANIMSPMAQKRLQQSVARLVAAQLASHASTREGRVTALSLGANVTDSTYVGSSSGSMNALVTGPERRKWLRETISIHVLQRP